jgi:hypothetical protein
MPVLALGRGSRARTAVGTTCTPNDRGAEAGGSVAPAPPPPSPAPGRSPPGTSATSIGSYSWHLLGVCPTGRMT